MNCYKILYMENAINYIDYDKSLVLANCFANIIILKSVYSNETINNVNKYIPVYFKNSTKITDELKNYVKNKYKK